MLARTLGEMVSRAKEMANMENHSFVSDAEWYGYVNQAAQQLYGKLLESRGAEFYSKEHTIPMVASQAYYQLPSDFFLLQFVMMDDGSGNHRPLEKFDLWLLAHLVNRQTVGGYSWFEYRYRLGNEKLEVRPAPDSTVYTVTVRYTPHMPELVNPLTDKFDGLNGWERWIELSAAVQALIKEGSTDEAAALMTEREMISRQIEFTKDRRDEHFPSQIRDVMNDDHDEFDIF
jgi:hypothetical protein